MVTSNHWLRQRTYCNASGQRSFPQGGGVGNSKIKPFEMFHFAVIQKFAVRKFSRIWYTWWINGISLEWSRTKRCCYNYNVKSTSQWLVSTSNWKSVEKHPCAHPRMFLNWFPIWSRYKPLWCGFNIVMKTTNLLVRDHSSIYHLFTMYMKLHPLYLVIICVLHATQTWTHTHWRKLFNSLSISRRNKPHTTSTSTPKTTVVLTGNHQ